MLADATGILPRWQHFLFEFDVDVLHCAGFNHQTAEALLIIPTNGNYNTSLEDELSDLVKEVET